MTSWYIGSSIVKANIKSQSYSKLHFCGASRAGFIELLAICFWSALLDVSGALDIRYDKQKLDSLKSIDHIETGLQLSTVRVPSTARSKGKVTREAIKHIRFFHKGAPPLRYQVLVRKEGPIYLSIPLRFTSRHVCLSQLPLVGPATNESV